MKKTQNLLETAMANSVILLMLLGQLKLTKMALLMLP